MRWKADDELDIIGPSDGVGNAELRLKAHCKRRDAFLGMLKGTALDRITVGAASAFMQAFALGKGEG